LSLEAGAQAQLSVRGKQVEVFGEETVVVPLDGQGPRLSGNAPSWVRDGVRRADGSVITASVPRASESSST
jgi:alpha,alpha-trehalose phosphorylase